MQNGCIGFADELKYIAGGGTFTLHFALCILHSYSFSLTNMGKTGYNTINM